MEPAEHAKKLLGLIKIESNLIWGDDMSDAMYFARLEEVVEKYNQEHNTPFDKDDMVWEFLESEDA